MGRHPQRFGARFDKKRARQLRYYQRSRERRLALQRRINYGCDQATYDSLLARQGGVCAICRKPETSVRNGRTKYLAVDHDHRTGRIRGLLCERHNIGIGNFKDGVVELSREPPPKKTCIQQLPGPRYQPSGPEGKDSNLPSSIGAATPVIVIFTTLQGRVAGSDTPLIASMSRYVLVSGAGIWRRA